VELAALSSRLGRQALPQLLRKGEGGGERACLPRWAVKQFRMAAPMLNPDRRMEIVRQGVERQPVIVIDDVLAEPEAWRALAGRLDYGRIGPHYPGLRAPVPPGAADAMRGELEGVLADTFDLDPVPPVFECYFSLVTTAPEALAPIQRLPHVDGLEQARIAILVFLSGTEMGGTAFTGSARRGSRRSTPSAFPASKRRFGRAWPSMGFRRPATYPATRRCTRRSQAMKRGRTGR
jgi:hypothetical protein